MRKFLKIEGIPTISAKIYSVVVSKSPYAKRLYKEIAGNAEKEGISESVKFHNIRDKIKI